MPSHPPTRRYPFLIANACFLRQPSVSPGLLITDVEHSVTTKRQHRWRTPLGSFTFHHIKPTWSHGYRWLKFSVCLCREKGLLDLAYLHPHAGDPACLQELRLRHLDLAQLRALAERSAKPKLRRFAEQVAALEAEAHETL